jgi:hypothetical protein
LIARHVDKSGMIVEGGPRKGSLTAKNAICSKTS